MALEDTRYIRRGPVIPESDMENEFFARFERRMKVPVQRKSRLNYYSLPGKLPMEIVIRILTFVDTKTIRGINMGTPAEFKLEAKISNRVRRGKSAWKLDYLWRCFEASVLTSTDLFHETAIKCQFPLVAKVFTRGLARWSYCPNLLLWGDMGSEEAFGFFEYWDARTELGVRSIQRGLPAMKQTNMIRFYLLHLWFWYGASSRCPKLHRPQEGWNYFATLPAFKQKGILNFFDNLSCSFLEACPPTFPSNTPAVEVSNNHCRRVCPNCSTNSEGKGNRGRSHRWRIPRYIATELDQLGVTDLLVKLLAITKLSKLYELLNTQSYEPLSPFAERRILNFFDRNKSTTRSWSWNDHYGPALFKTNSRFVMRLDDFTYEVWVHGKRGNGTIELRIPVTRPVASDWPRLFADAILTHQEKRRPLTISDWVRTNTAMPSYVIERKEYWNWADWKFEHDEDLGLDRILFVE